MKSLVLLTCLVILPVLSASEFIFENQDRRSLWQKTSLQIEKLENEIPSKEVE